MIKGYAEKGDLFVRIPRPDTVVVNRKLRSDTVYNGAEVVVFINKKDFSGKHNTLDARGGPYVIFCYWWKLHRSHNQSLSIYATDYFLAFFLVNAF